MGFFESDSEPKNSFLNPNYCPVCQKVGRFSLPVFIWDPEKHQVTEVCFKTICIYCQKGNGRLISLFTLLPGARPDFSLQKAILPPGIRMDSFKKAVEKNPKKNSFTPGEISQYDAYKR